MKQRKGIILAGGTATRLYPLTISISKQLMPIYNKPMIYYPLSILMKIGIKDILIISTPDDINNFKKLLGDGSSLGIKFEYKTQETPRGLADAFIIGEDFIGTDNVAMILGDNMFYGDKLQEALERANDQEENATIFGYYVKDPKAYGVVEINKKSEILSIEEKPEKPKSHYAIPGLYFYPNEVVEIAKSIQPSARGELEITSINEEFLKRNKLNVEILSKSTSWFDTGTPNALLETSSFVQTIENRQGILICSPEEIAYKNGWISNDELKLLSKKYINTDYGQYLYDLTM